MFSNVKTISAPKPAAVAKAAGGKATDQVEGWEQLAALDAAAKALTELVSLRKKEMEEETLKPAFIARGVVLKKKPESMSPVEGDARGSAYLAKRSTRSVLSEDDVAAISEASGIDVDDGNVEGFTKTLERRPAYLTVNPDYFPGGALYDEAKLRKVEKLLNKEVPDFIVQVEPEAQVVVDDAALDNVFKLDAQAIEAILPLVALINTRPVFSASLEKAWEVIKPLIPEAVSALATAKDSAKNKASLKKAGGKSLNEQLKASLSAAE